MQNLNQFKQSAVLGTLDLSTNANPDVFTCRFNYDDGSSDLMIPGEGAKLVDLGANDFVGPPFVDERALDGDPIFGVKIYTTKKNSAEVGEIVQIAGKGAVVFMNSGAAIVRGAKVSLVLATPGNVITTAGGSTLGTALDKVAGADELIRILIDPVTIST